MAALVLCGPIGLAGCLAARPGRLAILARLVIPLGALAEPFVLGHFSNLWPQRPWAERYSDAASGVILVALGAVGVAYALRRTMARTSGPATAGPGQTC